MTSAEWKKVHDDEDAKLRKKIKKLSGKSTRRLYLSVIIFIALFAEIGDFLNKIVEKLGNSADPGDLSQVRGFVETPILVQIVLMAVIAVFVLIRAAVLWNRSQNLEESRLYWYPSDEEVSDIRERFNNNDFVKFILSKISSEDTETVKVALDGITISNRTGKEFCSLNGCGYRRLSNYETKQLAYYIAEEAFNGNYTIYQTKRLETIYDRYVGGVTDKGDDGRKGPGIKAMIKKDALWLLTQISSMGIFKRPIYIPPAVKGPASVEGGQIIVNKGYNPEDYMFEEL